MKGLRENASKLEVQLFKTDAFIVTVGDRVSRILRVDKAGEKLATLEDSVNRINQVRVACIKVRLSGCVELFLIGCPAPGPDSTEILRGFRQI